MFALHLGLMRNKILMLDYILVDGTRKKQIPVSYQPIEDFYCVTADYTRDTNFCLFCNYAPRIDILNQARKGSVDGEKLGGAVRFFRGIIRRPRTAPAKITVGFFAAIQPRSSYWVVAAGSYADILLGMETIDSTSDYDWAIITGGPPSLVGANGTCKPDPGRLNFLGMWMFARDSIPPEGVIPAIELYALNVLNLDTSACSQSNMKDVSTTNTINDWSFKPLGFAGVEYCQKCKKK